MTIGACVVALGATLMLAFDHFGTISLPGCGAGSGCAKAAASVWGRVPGVDWPVSLVGAAYFIAMLVAWLMGRGRIGTAVRQIMMLGGIVSIVYLFALAVERIFCGYCVTVHVANLVMTIGAWGMRSDRTQRGLRALGQWVACCAVFLLSTFGLAVIDISTRDKAAARAEADLAETTRALRSASTPAAAAGTAPGEGAGAPVVNAAPATPSAGAGVFTGRNRFGPEQAAARVVMFTGYQCPDCKLLEAQVEELMKGAAFEGKVSISIKHFPLSTDCNPNAPGNHHENGCWAARAAETAGILGGADGFWRMHEWLFKRGGSFTEPELNAALPALGFEPSVFAKTMEEPRTLAMVRADVDEAMGLGISMTPMMFVNGVEVRGWNAPRALVRAVEAAIAANPAGGTAASDVPAVAAEKMLDDWRLMPRVELPEKLWSRSFGPADAPVRIVIFGDYEEPFTREADGLTRAFASGPDAQVRYVFAHFPVNQACNPASQITLHPNACLAHRAAEAGDLMGGTEGFWTIHEYLMMNREPLTREAVLTAAEVSGYDRATFEQAMDQTFVNDRIGEQAAIAAGLGVKSIPFIFVNGKHLPRFKAGNENIIPRVIRAAAEQASGGG